MLNRFALPLIATTMLAACGSTEQTSSASAPSPAASQATVSYSGTCSGIPTGSSTGTLSGLTLAWTTTG